MAMNHLDAYADVLSKCRFCPMCKPAAEVAGLTLLESHTTRARAMMLWQIAAGLASWQARDVELLYQCTLDSIAQAWCISHYPVSEYMAAARADVFAAGLAPAPVLRAVERGAQQNTSVRGDTVFLASEAAELGDKRAVELALRVLEQVGVHSEPLVVLNGALAYSLGARWRAREQATDAAEALRRSKARTVIADGPQTLWALRRLYPMMGVSLPDGLVVTSLAARLLEAMQAGRLTPAGHDGQRVFFHDSRSATLLADKMAQAEAIQPGYRGAEDQSGQGEIFQTPRLILDALGVQRLYSVWSRSLCKSCGADDGLWLTYPELAAGLAKRRLEETKRLGVTVLVTDSLLCARHLGRFANGEGVEVRWLPEMVAS